MDISSGGGPHKRNNRIRSQRISIYDTKQCTPHKTHVCYSCFDEGSIRKIAKALNSCSNVDINIKEHNTHKLYNEVCNVIKEKFKCNTEACWTTIRTLMNKLSKKDVITLKKYFKPLLPKDLLKSYTEWLSNLDIDKVLKQYHENLSDFYYFDAEPIDFRKCNVSNKLCSFNIQDYLKKGYKKLAFVFNTDVSHGKGKHWISMYIDCTGINLNGQPGIYYFDSFGDKPMKEVLAFIDRIKCQSKKKYIVSYNKRCHQNNTYACGFYCIHFIESMINGISFKKYVNSGINDKFMKEYIEHCFIHPKKI